MHLPAGSTGWPAAHRLSPLHRWWLQASAFLWSLHGEARTFSWNSKETSTHAYWFKSSSSLQGCISEEEQAVVTVFNQRQRQTSLRGDCCILGTGPICCQPQVNPRTLVPPRKLPRPFGPWEEIAHNFEESLQKETREWVEQRACVLPLRRKLGKRLSLQTLQFQFRYLRKVLGEDVLSMWALVPVLWKLTVYWGTQHTLSGL